MSTSFLVAWRSSWRTERARRGLVAWDAWGALRGFGSWRTDNRRGPTGSTMAPPWSRMAQTVAVVSWASSRHAGAVSGGLWLAGREEGENGSGGTAPS
jgi:hypothetical protein